MYICGKNVGGVASLDEKQQMKNNKKTNQCDCQPLLHGLPHGFKTKFLMSLVFIYILLLY